MVTLSTFSSSFSTSPPFPLLLFPQVVYVFGHNHVFCAVENIDHNIRYVPETTTGLAQWFGVTAFLFCVHSMVSLLLMHTSLLLLLFVVVVVVVIEARKWGINVVELYICVDDDLPGPLDEV